FLLQSCASTSWFLLATARVCTASALVLFVEAAFVFFSASCNLSMEAVAAVAIE
ncbi:hypothetical protein U1Q18_052185, partial [Sarracenia purpurea var. burkii]